MVKHGEEEVQQYVRDAVACEGSRMQGKKKIAWVPVDLCQWLISCATGLQACNDGCVWQKKWGHVCIIACVGGVIVFICMCVAISIPSGQVLALEIRLTYPCRTDGGQLDAPMQSQPNLEHWHWVQVTFPIYPWLPLPSGTAMPALTSPLLLLPSNLLRSQLPTTP